MPGFHKNIAAVFMLLAALTFLVAYICMKRSYLSAALFPAHESAVPWRLETLTDMWMGGSSSVSVSEDIYSLNYEYHLTEDVRFAFAAAVVAFSELENAKKLVDLSGYSTASFRVKCVPRSVLGFYIHSFDRSITDPGNFLSYRIPSAFFTCHEEWSDVEIDLQHLKIPEWWLQMSNLDVFDQGYRLDKVLAIAFVASQQESVNPSARVRIAELVLHGRDWRFAWLFAGFSAVVWIGFACWLFRQYTLRLVASLRDKMKKDRPLEAYQKLSIKPHRDKEKSQLLRFMAAEYRNPDMSLEFAVARVGINRTKINALLRDELGMTFSAYLNKLRLAEAARLLSHKDDANVAAIARFVGYSNVTYFNKLFKNEYGRTPKTFKNACGSAGAFYAGDSE